MRGSVYGDWRCARRGEAAYNEMCREGGSSVQGDVRGDVQGDVQGGGVKEEAGAGGSAVDYRALD